MDPLSTHPRPKRPRHTVAPPLVRLLRPFLRFSHSRDAYVLRLVGNRVGPVLRPGPASRQARRLVDAR